jgi:hypothetical protein
MIGFVGTSVTVSLNYNLSLIYTMYSSPLHTHQDSQLSLVVSSNGSHLKSTASLSQSQSYFTTGDLPPIISSWPQAP